MRGLARGLMVFLGIGLCGALAFSAHSGFSFGPRDGLYCDFENVKVWDISPERGFSLSLSNEHVTQGAFSLHVAFPKAAWPSINTRKLRQPLKRFDRLEVDVFNPQPKALAFAVRLDDRAGHRMTVGRTLQPGMNHVTIPQKYLAEHLDTRRLAFIALFLPRPKQPVTLYFDGLRLVVTPPSEAGKAKQDREKTSKPAVKQPSPAKRASPPAKPVPPPTATALPTPLPQRLPQRAGSLDVRVVKLRTGPQPHALVSTGIPFAPGALTSERELVVLHQGREVPVGAKVLARWPQDGSIRSLLVQFRLEIPEVDESITMKWGERRATPDVELAEVAWEYPEALLQLPAWWLCESQVIGEQVPMYEHDFPEYDEHIRSTYPKRRDDRPTGEIANDGFYSTPHVFYQLYVRSGDLDIFLAARREAIRYRDHEIVHEGPDRGRNRQHAETRYVYVEAMADDYLLTGDARSLDVAKEMAGYLGRQFPPEKAFYPKEAAHFFTEREATFPFLGVLAYYEISGEASARRLADQYMEQLWRTQQQWPDRGGFIHHLYSHDPEEGARPGEYGGSPFMTGLLLEAVVKHHRLTASPKAAQSLFMALDWLINEGLASDGQTFRYLTAEKYRHASGEHPDLNLLIVHAFGYGYQLSGYTRSDYLRVGTKAFRRGIKDAYLGKRKHFNQNYRSSGHFLAYIRRTDQEPQAAAPEETPFFYQADFEATPGGWVVTSPPDATAMVDDATAYRGRYALAVTGGQPGEPLVLEKRFETWNLDAHPRLRCAYKLTAGTAVDLRFQTAYGDWVSWRETMRADGLPELSDDGQWHEVTIDVRQAVKRVLPGVNALTAVHYVAQGGANAQRGFWIDDCTIFRDE